MRFALQSFGPFLHWLTLIILCVMPLIAAYVVYKLGSLPGTIARERHHPQAAAINVCGWMGLVTVVLWPVAMVWAHLTPAAMAPSDQPSAELLSRLRHAADRLSALETHRSKGPGIQEI